MFANVIKAIVDLKDDEGATVNSIAEKLRCKIIERQCRNNCNNSFVSRVKRALQHGIKAGIIVREKDKYKLGICNECYEKPTIADLGRVLPPLEYCPDYKQKNKCRYTDYKVNSITDLGQYLPKVRDCSKQKGYILNENKQRGCGVARKFLNNLPDLQSILKELKSCTKRKIGKDRNRRRLNCIGSISDLDAVLPKIRFCPNEKRRKAYKDDCSKHKPGNL